MHNFGGKKGNTLVVSWVKVMHEMATKLKVHYESTRKHMVLFNKKGSFDRESLVAL
jgi:hypothetical protein